MDMLIWIGLALLGYFYFIKKGGVGAATTLPTTVDPSVPATFLPAFNVIPYAAWMVNPSVHLGPVVMWNGVPYQEVPEGSGNYVKTAYGVTQ